MQPTDYGLDVVGLTAALVAIIGAIFRGHALLKKSEVKCNQFELEIAAVKARVDFLEAVLPSSEDYSYTWEDDDEDDDEDGGMYEE